MRSVGDPRALLKTLRVTIESVLWIKRHITLSPEEAMYVLKISPVTK